MVDHYTYRVSWSKEDKEFAGTCAEFPSLSHLAADRVEALRGIEDLVRDVVADMQENGEPIPERAATTRASDNRYVGGKTQTAPPNEEDAVS